MASKDPFAARVEAGLRGRGLTLRGLCREAGLDASFFSKVLAGKRSPPSEEGMLRRIADILRLDAVELIVSAGRIPAEWSALWDDAELFHEVHSRASSGVAGRPGPAADGTHRLRTAAKRPPSSAIKPIGAGGKEFRPAGTGGTSDTAGVTRPSGASVEIVPHKGLSEELL